jgi:hypothetical protein
LGKAVRNLAGKLLRTDGFANEVCGTQGEAALNFVLMMQRG